MICEVTSLKIDDYNPENGMINASDIHDGKTKSSWISYVMQQTFAYLDEYLDKYFEEYEDEVNGPLFHVSTRYVQNTFKTVS